MTAAKKKAAPKAASKPRLGKKPVVRVEADAPAPFVHAAAAVSDSMRGWRVKHHMTKYHERPDTENPFSKLRPDGTCSFCGGRP